MGKAKALKHNADKGKQQLHGIKSGSIKKNKDSKFKNTPTDRKPSPKVVANKYSGQKLTSNKNKAAKKHWDQKPITNGNSVAKQSKQESPNKKQNFKQNTNSSKAQKNDNKTFNSRKMKNQFDRSNSNITESEDDSSNESDETSDSYSDFDIPDILGKSLAEESDDDDEDYKEDENDDDDDSNEEETDDDDDSDEEEMIERKGVKMFKGLQSKTKKNKIYQNEDDDNDDDEVESDENTTSTESDEDDDENDTDEDKDEDEKEKKKDGRPRIEFVKSYIRYNPKLLEDPNYVYNSDDFKTDPSSDDDSDSEDAELGIKALLEKSIADDDDDDKDFSEKDIDISTDDSDISYEDCSTCLEYDEDEGPEPIFIGPYSITQEERDDLAKRIVLIDNISNKTSTDDLKKVCLKYGEMELFEARPYPAFFIEYYKQPKLKKWLEQDYPDLDTYSANVLYKKKKDALKAMKFMHGTNMDGKYLNVVTANDTEQEPPHAVYVIDLKKGIDDNSLWKVFKPCGRIMRFRNVRDQLTGKSIGFGYIGFDNEDSVKRALKLNGMPLKGQPMKVLRYPYRRRASHNNLEEGIKRKKQGIKRILSLQNDMKSKKFKKSSGEPAARNVEPERTVKKNKKQQIKKSKENKEKSTAFQGQMVGLKNKNKKTKLDKKKKKMAGKLTAKSAKKV